MKQQYTTRGQFREGYKKCRFCGEVIPGGTACDCSITIRLRGSQKTIERTIEQLQAILTIIEIDDYKEHIDTGEGSIELVAQLPIIAILPGKESEGGGGRR